MRLIDADNLADRFKAAIVPDAYKPSYSIHEILIEIEHEPTVDMPNEKAGKWIDVKGGMKYECSECGGDVLYRKKYCPNCGAKMG